MEENSKKKRGRGTRAAAAGVILLLLAGTGVRTGGFGLLPEQGTSLLPESGQVETAAPVPTDAPEAVAEDDGVLTVRVSENVIYFEDEPVSAGQLEEALLRAYAEGAQVELVNDRAIKADYDEAVAVLERLGIPYTGVG